MKATILGLFACLMCIEAAYSQEVGRITDPVADEAGQEVLDLSRQKWLWMSERNVDSLDRLFLDNAVFVHMGATMTKEQELNTIRTGGIHYKRADIQETSVRFAGDTAIVLDRLRLTAVVGGNEVVNPFTVTEVYVPIDGRWRLASLSFTRLLGE